MWSIWVSMLYLFSAPSLLCGLRRRSCGLHRCPGGLHRCPGGFRRRAWTLLRPSCCDDDSRKGHCSARRKPSLPGRRTPQPLERAAGLDGRRRAHRRERPRLHGGVDRAARHQARHHAREQDEFAALSHQRAAAAIKNGLLADEIVGVEIPRRGGDPLIFAEDEGVRADVFAEDEGVRADTTAESLSR
jgi:hypothetical protein